MNVYRTQYATHSDLLPDVLDTISALHADDRAKRVVLTRRGAAPIAITYHDGESNGGGKLIDALGAIDISAHDVDMYVFHNADGVQRVMGWRLLTSLIVEIIPIAILAARLPAPAAGQHRTIAERRLDFAASV